ncbi:ABC transporter ATP-binding protein [Actibacterium sp. D379-3]
MTDAPGLRICGSARIGTVPIFGPLDLTVMAGGWSCLLGPSGVGKSTLLRLCAGLDQGIDFDGRISASDGAPLIGRVALMAQSDLLLPWLTVLGNVMLGARLRGQRPARDRAETVLERVGLLDCRARKPGALSGGQRQRVALARTLMEDRPVVLLDEPFGALDARTRSQMQDLTAELLAGRTVLLVTHDPGEAARLGHAIHILTETGLQAFPAPGGPAPRAVDDPDMLRTQGRLLSHLRAGAA